MRKKFRHFFTLPEVTMAIAILGIGLLSIMGVFPVAVKSGMQAAKISESIHKARAAASLYQNFALEAPMAEPMPYNMPIKSSVETFAFKGFDNLVGETNCTFEIPLVAKSRDGTVIKDNLGVPIPGIKIAVPGFLNNKFQLDRVFLTVNDEFDTFFYVIRKKP